ncbi:hypothetical protein PFISCL1PPCAC_21515 [Pristionchus fissidentatus]|uniref:BTB domain-containing protein n=1 Tax=Pristionchus fissidentatus TaxID=1538716 RepID=A0AAV5WHT2_9BILA|nr:hypothetical protein PFISCL1PPCAC_21515 [Pristionchus fissidentatus]
MKRKADELKEENANSSIDQEEEEEEDDDFILSLRPKGTLAIKVLADRTKWNAELTLDKPSRDSPGVPPLALTITPLQIEPEDPKSSLHLVLEKEDGKGVTELMNAHLDTPSATAETVFRLNPYLGILPLHDGQPFNGAVLKRQSITATTKKRKGEKDSYLLKMIIEDGEKAVVSQFPKDSLHPIETGNIMMEQTNVSVSKEYLGLQSDFFAQIFYGGYMEGKQEVVELQEVNAEEGHLLINNLYARRPNLSLDDTRVLLSLADRFSLVVLMRKCIEDLLNQDANLSDDSSAKAQFLLMADRSKSTNAMQKILATFKTSTELHEAVMTIAANVSHASMVVIFEFMAKMAMSLERKLIIEKRPKIFFKFGSKRCVVQLLQENVPVMAKRFLDICRRDYKLTNGEPLVFTTFHKLEAGGKQYSTFKSENAWTDGLTEQYVPDMKLTGLYLAARVDPNYAERHVYVVKHNTRFTNPMTYFGKFVEGSHVTENQPAGARYHFGIY